MIFQDHLGSPFDFLCQVLFSIYMRKNDNAMLLLLKWGFFWCNWHIFFPNL